MLEQSIDRGSRRLCKVRRLIAGLAVAGTISAVPVLTVGADATGPAAARTCGASRAVQMVEANIKSGMTKAQTAADLAKVYADRPDFVAFNEVARRPDAQLAPAGYRLWRTPGVYAGANPVSWRTDRWNAIALGTIFLTNQPGRTGTQTTELGIRYANWATLRSVDGCQTISVVAYHVAPKTAQTEGLLLPSVHKLGGLARSLATDGPVLLAGDLNRHYRSRDYPRSTLSAYGLTPTWDMTGTMLPTGDHRGATIDYIFAHTAAQFTVTRQITRELNSDHDALVANLTVNSKAIVARPSTTFVRGHVLNVPDSPFSAGRRAVITRILRAIQLAPKASTILLGTARLDGSGLRNALLAAHRRGVNVRIVSWSPQRSLQEKILMRELGQSLERRSFAVRRAYSTAAALPPTAMVFSSSAGIRTLGIQVDQPLDGRIVALTSRSQVTVEEADFLRLRTALRRQFR